MGEKRERKERGEEEEDFRERESTFSLDFPEVGPSNFDETRRKVDPHCKSYAWTLYCGVSKTPGGRGFSPTWFISYLRTVQMVGVFGAEKAVCFGSSKWDPKLEILDYFGQSKLGLETAFEWS